MEVRRSGPKARPEIPARSSPARTGGPGPLPASAASRRKALRWRRRVRPVDVRIDLSSLARLSSLCLVEKEPRCPVRRTVSLPMACSSCQVGKNRAGAGGAVPAGRRGRGGTRGRRAGARSPSPVVAGPPDGFSRVGRASREQSLGAAGSRGGEPAEDGNGGGAGRERGRRERSRPAGRGRSGRAGGGLPAASGAAGPWLYSRRLLRRAGSRKVVVPSPGSVRLVHLGRFGSAGSTRRWRSPAGLAIGSRHMEVAIWKSLVRLACGRAVLVACGVRGAGRRRRVGRAVSPEASAAGPLPADRSRSLRVP